MIFMSQYARALFGQRQLGGHLPLVAMCGSGAAIIASAKRLSRAASIFAFASGELSRYADVDQRMIHPEQILAVLAVRQHWAKYAWIGDVTTWRIRGSTPARIARLGSTSHCPKGYEPSRSSARAQRRCRDRPWRCTSQHHLRWEQETARRDSTVLTGIDEETDKTRSSLRCLPRRGENLGRRDRQARPKPGLRIQRRSWPPLWAAKV